MKKLVLVLAMFLILLANIPSSRAGYIYELRGTMVNVDVAQLGGYPLNQVTEPPFADLVFVDCFIPVSGASFTGDDVASLNVWNRERTVVIADYLPGDTIAGTFSTTSITNGLPEINLFMQATDDSTLRLNADDTLTLIPNEFGNPFILTGTTFTAQANSVGPLCTGIQICGITSNLVDTVEVGDTMQLTIPAITGSMETISYQFFRRLGYGAADWGGNKWQVMQNWSSTNSANITFDTPGIYYVAVHCEHQGNSWEVSDPQGGFSVEVSEPSATGIQIFGISTNLGDTVQVGDTLQFTVYAGTNRMQTIDYQFFRRAGYGQPDWGGNDWEVVQNWSDQSSVNITFTKAGIYFVAAHLERTGEKWAFGDPQTGIVVEVWPTQ